MDFPGKFISDNITPAKLNSWTHGEIFRAITTGVSKDGKPLFDVMSYHYYGKLDEDDIKAIIAPWILLTIRVCDLRLLPKSKPGIRRLKWHFSGSARNL